MVVSVVVKRSVGVGIPQKMPMEKTKLNKKSETSQIIYISFCDAPKKNLPLNLLQAYPFILI